VEGAGSVSIHGCLFSPQKKQRKILLLSLSCKKKPLLGLCGTKLAVFSFVTTRFLRMVAGLVAGYGTRSL
jgi:hypothetical protein